MSGAVGDIQTVKSIGAQGPQGDPGTSGAITSVVGNTATRIAVFSGAAQLTGYDDLTFDAGNQVVKIGGSATAFLSPSYVVGETQLAEGSLVSQVDFSISVGTSILTLPIPGNNLELKRKANNRLRFTNADDGFVVDCDGPLSFNGAGDFSISSGSASWKFDGTTGALVPTFGTPDVGASGAPAGTGYFGTSVVSPLFSVASGAGNSGITTTITTASLVGKTITIQGGIITGFA